MPSCEFLSVLFYWKTENSFNYPIYMFFSQTITAVMQMSQLCWNWESHFVSLTQRFSVNDWETNADSCISLNNLLAGEFWCGVGSDTHDSYLGFVWSFAQHFLLVCWIHCCTQKWHPEPSNLGRSRMWEVLTLMKWNADCSAGSARESMTVWLVVQCICMCICWILSS